MITANIGLNAVALSAGDNTIINLSGSVLREGVQQAIAHNTTASPVTVNCYESPDTTSGSGLLLWSQDIAANSDEIITGIVGQGFEQGQNLIVNAGGAGVNLKLTVTRSES
ncbi:MAG: hypothetical protein ACN2B6_00920 [Rickettsiales bacterium]